MKKLSLVLVIIFCLTNIRWQLYAQEVDYHYLHFTQKDGLPSNTVYSVTQDKDGYLWIGTDAGVSKFDGINFKNYTVEDGLPSNEVIHMYCDHKNRIWLSSMSRKIVYIEHDKIITQNEDPLLKEIYIQSPTFFYEKGEKDNFFIVPAYPAGVLYEVENNKLKKYTSIRNDPTHRTFEFNNKLIIIATKGIEIRKKNNLIPYLKTDSLLPIRDIIKLKSNLFACIDDNFKFSLDSLINGNFKGNYGLKFIDKILYTYNDSLIIARTINGVLLYNIKQKITETILLKNHLSAFVFVDFEKNIWLPTLDNGLYMINNLTNLSAISNKENLKFNIHSVTKKNNNIFFGNIDGHLFKYNQFNSKQISDIGFIKRIENTSNRILKITFGNTNELCVTCDAGIFQINLGIKSIKKFPPIASFKNHYQFANKLIYLTNGVFISYNGQFSNIIRNKINSRFYAAVDNKTQIILGSENGLHTFDFHSIKDYPLNLPIKTRFTDLKVYKDRLYASTIDKGVFVINGHNLIRNFNVNNGLSSNTCNKLQFYHDKLFVASKKGISIINLKNDTYQYIFESDGLASNTVNDFVIENDTLIAATEKGISFISLSSLRDQPKPIYFVNPIIVNNDTIWDATHVTYQNKHTLILNLNSISFNTESKIVHYYRIKGFDTNWHSTIDHQIRINYLEPGNYIIESFAVNSYNTRSATKQLSIYVSPYFYQTVPFHLFVVALIIFLFYYFNRFRERIIKETEKIRQELMIQSSALELSVWRSKINPHFVFNSLNTVQSLYQASEFEQANQYMSNFSQIIRKTIDSSNNLFLTLQEEIDYHTKYLELEKIKRKGSFSFTIQYSSEKLLKLLIPTMTLQPILENSLKHGIQNKNPGILSINFILHDQCYICEISDNGSGIKGEIQPTSHGLALVNQKIEIIKKLTSQEIKFGYHNIFDEKNTIIGFKTTFTFPFFNPLNDFNEGHNN